MSTPLFSPSTPLDLKDSLFRVRSHGAIITREKGAGSGTSSSSSSSSSTTSLTASSSLNLAGSSETGGDGGDDGDDDRKELPKINCDTDNCQFSDFQQLMAHKLYACQSFVLAVLEGHLRELIARALPELLPVEFAGDRFVLIERLVEAYLTDHPNLRRIPRNDPNLIAGEYLVMLPYLNFPAHAQQGRELRVRLAAEYLNFFEVVLPLIATSDEERDLNQTTLDDLRAIIALNGVGTQTHERQFVVVSLGNGQQIRAHQEYIHEHFPNAYSDTRQRQDLFNFLHAHYFADGLDYSRPYVENRRIRELIHRICQVMGIDRWDGDYLLFLERMVELYFAHPGVSQIPGDVRDVIHEYRMMLPMIGVPANHSAGNQARIALLEHYHRYFAQYISSHPDELRGDLEALGQTNRLIEAKIKALNKRMRKAKKR